MPGDRQPPSDIKLSEMDVKRVLERAARIDTAQQAVSVADLAQAASDAGISEQAVLQAVSELLEARQLMPVADTGKSVTGGAPSRVRSWVRAAASGLALVIGLILIYVVLRVFP
jgi:hypothetical protein